MDAATAATSASASNSVTAQTLTVVGNQGSSTAAVAAHDTAAVIAGKINAITASTGVTATADTSATIGSLNGNGNVSFTLQGTNTTAVSINATVVSNDLTNLANAINSQSGNTGITATLSANKAGISLDQAQGYDIKIANASITGGSTFSLTGAVGSAQTLGASTTTNASTVGGIVSFSSAAGFNVTSTADTASGSLFSTAANGANVSSLASVDQIDITTTAGAASAIQTVDGALSQIDSIRGGLGAVQNRFQSTISNLSNVSENLSAARSQIMDADVAQETSNMTKENILQQAGVAILAQANQAPQLALTLLK
ncbi:MAG: flagellin [Desulfocapsaceae bacterium]|nr:flagellin [Desulfocapsaceae bacterium]